MTKNKSKVIKVINTSSPSQSAPNDGREDEKLDFVPDNSPEAIQRRNMENKSIEARFGQDRKWRREVGITGRCTRRQYYNMKPTPAERDAKKIDLIRQQAEKAAEGDTLSQVSLTE